MLGRLAARLAAEPDWWASTLEPAVRAFAEAEELKLGAVAQPLRAAVTGRAASPGIFEVLVALGRAESLARLADAAV
jgi:glutamyl-tRNA synthetase